MTSQENRKKTCNDIEEAVQKGARVKEACKLLSLGHKTFLRWKDSSLGDLRSKVKKISSKALSQEEIDLIVTTCNSNEFKDKSPNQIVPILAERGIYIASESMFYRVLKKKELLEYREDSKKPKTPYSPPELIATGPNQVLSWDITYLKTSIKGVYFYLYLFLDIWSRKISGWTIAENESSDIASKLIESICIKNNIESIRLHSDNGSPMKSGTMLATLQNLGVIPSFSRPRVSNDNPFSESLFKTLKYRASYPSHFISIEEANEWVNGFVSWYNTEHRHSALKFVTPEQRHLGLDIEILKKREETYKKAKKKNPSRWIKNTRNWIRQEVVTLNKKTEIIIAKKIS